MQCYVYKGERKPDYFVYLGQELDLHEPQEVLPPSVIALLGDLEFVLEFELTADRNLAQAEAAVVLSDISEQGFYLQMPKKDMRAEEDRVFN